MHSMRRQCLLCLLALCGQAWLSAQNISVKSFRLLDTDLTANFLETQEIDQNGEVAALIKVITTETGFMFDVGALGIVRLVQKPGEIWVYVPHGVQRININHQKLGRLKEPYYFSIPIQAARTYELVLTASRVKTIVEEDAGGGFLSLKVTPPTAMVLIDDNLQALDADGTLSLFLIYGEHTYRVEAPGYHPETGRVEFLIEETKTIEVTLKELSKASVTFTTSMSDAEIWVNNKLTGTGEWTGGLSAGTYIVETRKAGHRPRRTVVTVADGELRTVTLEAPVPMVGRLRAESKPAGADVFLGEKNLGRTPGIFNDVLIGTHTLTFRKEGFTDQAIEVTVEEGKVSPVSAQLTRSGQAEVSPQPIAPSAPPASPKSFSKGKEHDFLRKTNYYADVHYALGNPSAIGASAGTFLGGFNVEGSYDLAPSSGMDVIWYELENGVYTPFTMKYTPSSFISGCVGYGILIGDRIRLTPRVGAAVLAIKGNEKLRNGKNKEQNQKTYIFSGTASLRAEYALTRLLSLYVAPSFNLPLKRGGTAERLQNESETFPKWNSGLSARIGISFNF